MENTNERRNKTVVEPLKWIWKKIKSRVNMVEKHTIRSWRHGFEQWCVIDFHPLVHSLGRRERVREKEIVRPLSTQAFSLPPPHNRRWKRGTLWREPVFIATSMWMRFETGRMDMCRAKWSHARHSRLIAAKLARLSTIRWNFRNFLLDHRSALVALRRNHGLECVRREGDAILNRNTRDDFQQ